MRSAGRAWAGGFIIFFTLAFVAGCDTWFHDRCVDKECLFTREEWTIVGHLANVSLSRPQVDPSNARLADLLTDAEWAKVKDAGSIDDVHPMVRLGWRLYHDVRLSGDDLSAKDSLGRPATAPPARPRPGSETVCPGQLGISCATCHDPAAYGSDVTSQPPNVSSGAGWYDVNGQQTLNVARFFPIFYWNGRADSLWSQAAQVTESSFSMNGHRLKTFRLVCQHYLSTVVPVDRKAEGYDILFADDPSTPAVAALCASDKVAALEDSSPTATPAGTTVRSYISTYGELAASDKEIVNRVHVNASKSIAAYETFLTSDESRFDHYYNEPDKDRQSTLLSPSEQRGLKLFIGHAGCVNCHNGPMFSDGQFHNVGVPQAGEHVPTLAACQGAPSAPSCSCVVPAAEPVDAGSPADLCATPDYGATCLPVGAYAGWKKLHTAAEAVSPPVPTTLFRRCTCFADDFASLTSACGGEDADGGVSDDDPRGCPDAPDAGAADAGAPSPPPQWKVGAWRTPSLRDVAMTAPYMHDGVYATLEDVVWHYDQAPAVQDCTMGKSEIAPLNLSDQDRSDLVAFLGTLTGHPGPKVLIDPPDAAEFATCPAAETDGGAEGGAGDGALDASGDGADGGDGP